MTLDHTFSSLCDAFSTHRPASGISLIILQRDGVNTPIFGVSLAADVGWVADGELYLLDVTHTYIKVLATDTIILDV